MSSYMTDDIIIIKYDTEDIYNDPAPTSEKPVKGKIEYKTKLLSGLSGEDVVAGTRGMMVSSASVLLPESIDVALERTLNHQDKLKFGGVEHAILKIDQPKAFSKYFVYKYQVWVA